MPGRTWETCRAGHRFNALQRDKRPQPLARSLTRAGGSEEVNSRLLLLLSVAMEAAWGRYANQAGFL